MRYGLCSGNGYGLCSDKLGIFNCHLKGSSMSVSYRYIAAETKHSVVIEAA